MDTSSIVSLNKLSELVGEGRSFRGKVECGVSAVPPLPFYLLGPPGAPVVVVVGGMHGDEPSGVAAVVRLGQVLEAADGLLARILGLPVLNLLAFSERRRVWSGDGLDMNRLFDPGKSVSAPSAELAEKLFGLLTSVNAALLIDLHAGGDHELVTHIRTHGDGGRRLWSTLGVNWVQRFELPRGFLIRAMVEREVPAFTMEVGGAGLDETAVQEAVDAVLSLLSNCGWLDAPDRGRELPLMRTILRQPAGEAGLFFERMVPLARFYPAGTEIGRFLNLTTGATEAFCTSAAGVLAATICSGPVEPTNHIYELVEREDGDLSAANWVDGTSAVAKDGLNGGR